MGDRGNIKVYMNKAPVYLYTHDRGSEIYGVVKRVLAKRQNWDDAQYLARMLFCELVKGEESDSGGFGIGTYLCDNDHTILALNTNTQMITFEKPDGQSKGELSFEDMVTKIDKWSNTL